MNGVVHGQGGGGVKQFLGGLKNIAALRAQNVQTYPTPPKKSLYTPLECCDLKFKENSRNLNRKKEKMARCLKKLKYTNISRSGLYNSPTLLAFLSDVSQSYI